MTPLPVSTPTSEPTAVDAFGDWHDRGGGDAGDDAGARYRSLLPTTPLRAGEQYRFEVDLDACSGCKACVSACHSLNGLEESEIWRSVGLLVGGGGSAPVWNQNVTTACHHCVEPACLAGCPVDAYEKDPVTGIVAHLDDQCIGCRYCQLTCPYEVPTFSKRLGVVRKCDMCADRLAEGEAPACVQGCPTDAISIGVVDRSELLLEVGLDDPESGPTRLVPTAPVSSLTVPSTRYRTARAVPTDAVAADDHRIVPASNHVPLVVMLVLTQLSVGAVLVSQAGSWMGRDLAGGTAVELALLAAVVAIGASVLHLGRPLVAWRAVLGLGHSWLSREIVAFGGYGVAAVAAAAADDVLPGSWSVPFGSAAVVVGIIGVGCSAQLYAITGRAWWRLDRTLLRFAVTGLAAGAAAVGVSSAAGSWVAGEAAAASTTTVCVLVAGSVGCALVAAGSFVLRHHGRPGPLGRTVWLLTHTLRRTAMTGVGLALVSVAAAVAAAATTSPAGSTGCWVIALIAVTAAAGAERSLFFTASAPDRMPGGFH